MLQSDANNSREIYVEDLGSSRSLRITSSTPISRRAEHTAHEIKAAEAARANSLSLLMAERDYPLQISANDDVTRVIAHHSPNAVELLRESPAWRRA